MENMSVYSVVVYYVNGGSRGYLASAEDRNKLMENWQMFWTITRLLPFILEKSLKWKT